MARNVGRRGWLGVGVTVVVLGGIAIVAIWMSLQGSTNPDYQIRTERSGIGEYYVNLWVEPQPPTTGEAEISTQLSTIIGTPIELNYLEIDVDPPDDGERQSLETQHTFDGPNDGDLYVANANFEQTGTWRVIVRYSFGGPEVASEFDIEVAD